MKLGRNLARTFLDYYKLQNHIIFNPTAAIMPKLNSNGYMKTSTSSVMQSSQNNLSSNTTSNSTNNNKNTKRSASNVSMHPLKPLASPNLVQHSNSSMSNTSAGSQTTTVTATGGAATVTTAAAQGEAANVTATTQTNNISNGTNTKPAKFYLDNND
jgi:hypothetical protein